MRSDDAGDGGGAGPSPDGTDLETFFRLRYRSLVGYAYLLTGDGHEAEDLVQTALGRCFARWSTLDHATSEAYVRKVVARLAWRRATRSRPVPVAELPTLAALDTDGHVELRTLVDGLPTDQRVVVVLRYWAGLSEAQIADHLGCRPGTVKSRAARAVARLRASWVEPDPATTSPTGPRTRTRTTPTERNPA